MKKMLRNRWNSTIFGSGSYRFNVTICCTVILDCQAKDLYSTQFTRVSFKNRLKSSTSSHKVIIF